MPASCEIAPMRRSKPSAPEVLRKHAAIVTKLVNPGAVQPVHCGGFQSPPSSDGFQDLTLAGSSKRGYGGIGSVPHGGCGPASGSASMILDAGPAARTAVRSGVRRLAAALPSSRSARAAACDPAQENFPRFACVAGPSTVQINKIAARARAFRTRDRHFLFCISNIANRFQSTLYFNAIPELTETCFKRRKPGT